MKTQLAKVGLGFVSLVLLAHILWLAYGMANTDATASLLWQRGGATVALAIGLTLLWRNTSIQRSQPHPRHSFVLLLRGPRLLTVKQLQHATDTALGIQCTNNDRHASNCIIDTHPTFRIHANGYSFQVNNSTTPYIDQADNTPENIPNVRLQQIVREHTAWISVDLLGAPPQASIDEIYQCLGRITAALADDDCLGLCCPEMNQLNIWHPTLVAHLQGEHPRRAVSELVDVPAIRICIDDARMGEATKKALSMWSVFEHAFSQRHPEQTFAVKVPFTDGHETEYMWLIVTEMHHERVTGTLDNDPIYVRHLRAGDIVTIATDQVNDWLYTDKGEIVGGFTTEALSKQLAA